MLNVYLPIGSMGLVYLPTIRLQLVEKSQNLGKYTTGSSYKWGENGDNPYK